MTGPTLTVPAGVSEFEYPLHLPPWMEIGRTCRVCVMAVGIIEDRDGSKHTVSFCSVHQNEQYVAVVEAGNLDVSTDRASLGLRSGESGELLVKVTRGHKLAGPVRLELIVPEHMRGIEAAPVTIPAGASQARFAIRLAGERPGFFNMPLTLRATLPGKEGPTVAETRVEIALRCEKPCPVMFPSIPAPDCG